MEEDEVRRRLRTLAPSASADARLRNVLLRARRKKRNRYIGLSVLGSISLLLSWFAAAALFSNDVEQDGRVARSTQHLLEGSAASSEPSEGTPGGGEKCDRAPVYPTYLPWLDQGEDIPKPRFSYDSEIDRAQESWQNPQLPEGEGGVGLTRYSLPYRSQKGEPVGHKIKAVEGFVNVGEGETVSAYWDIDSHCNFVELSLVDPRLSVEETIKELKNVARSLEPRP